ncbi:hypothetical protein JTB14_005541 [Gonioctena quinquepunctata]|nr:hypothetical protein JTB14_005541 [Gonioctena quinquepunctata]
MCVTGVAKFGARHVAKLIKNMKGHDKCLQKVNVKHLENGSCIAEMKVDEEHLNPMGTLHGGFSALLVDVISSWAVLSHKNCEHPNVSVDLNLTFLKGAKKDEEIVIDASTLKVGKTLAFLEVSIKNKESGELLVKGSHTKFILRNT